MKGFWFSGIMLVASNSSTLLENLKLAGLSSLLQCSGAFSSWKEAYIKVTRRALPVHFKWAKRGLLPSTFHHGYRGRSVTARKINGAWLPLLTSQRQKKGGEKKCGKKGESEEKNKKKTSGLILIFMNFPPAHFSSFD